MSLLEWELRETMLEYEEVERLIQDVTEKLDHAKERQKEMKADMSKIRTRSRLRSSKEYLTEAFQEIDSFLFTMDLKLKKALARREQIELKLKRLKENPL
jgi:chromosome segregation ATPase